MQFVIKGRVATNKFPEKTVHKLFPEMPDIIAKLNIFPKKKKKRRHCSVYLHSTEGVLVFALLTEINSVSKELVGGKLKSTLPGH